MRRRGLPDAVQAGLHLAEHAGRGHDQDDDADDRRQHSLARLGGTFDHRLQRLGGLVAHKNTELIHDRALGGVVAEDKASNGDHDQQDRRDREKRIVGNRRAAAQPIVVDEALDRVTEKQPDALWKTSADHRCPGTIGWPDSSSCVSASQAMSFAVPNTGVGIGMTRAIETSGLRILPATTTGPCRSSRSNFFGSALIWTFTTWEVSATWPSTWSTDFSVSNKVRWSVTLPCWKSSRLSAQRIGMR